MGKQNYKVTMVDGSTYYLYQSNIASTRHGTGYRFMVYHEAYREPFWQNGMKQVPSDLMINIFQIVSLERIE